MKTANASTAEVIPGMPASRVDFIGSSTPDALGHLDVSDDLEVSDDLDAQLLRMDPISLEELNVQARLMTRVDRKYFLPRALFVELLQATEDDFSVLEIGAKRRFEYRTVYFDSPEFRFFRDHVQERRHRYKVRTRTYMETGTCHLEVKSKGYRGQTVKERIPHPLDSPGSLSETDVGFIDSIIGGGPHRQVSADSLEPVLETIYDRITLCHDHQRLTCDLNIRAINGSEAHDGPNDVLVETKSAGGGGIWDALLKQHGIRPHKVSKYCVAASLLYPELPSNPWKQTIKRYFA